ncbi:hypothetical protein RJ40_05080 [Methanofollis aquaemaris]|uniref:Exonuclease domain-containing protein n=1 Tax=Methanofollis aquaemaris TaxID=126734 RepID=A0A8A3S444_9EURY|nr:hypothetical protein [Methanofollis aquaemaris]QSZ66908.1 hypothetical protein RJ40_05080 [Methanofollis aquaemaris]
MNQKSGRVACVDMEFGHIYGTHRALVMPIEVGAVIYDPMSDQAKFAGITSGYDIEVEVWLNTTDALGRKTGVVTHVANPGRMHTDIAYDPRHRLDRDGWRAARKTVAASFDDLGVFMERLCLEEEVERFAFFAKNMECRALDRAGFDLAPYRCTDLQRDIKTALHMKDFLSLDRSASIIGFETEKGEIKSNRFSYSVPDRYLPSIRPHSAVGDAARIFLLAREFYTGTERFLSEAEIYLTRCEREGSSA